MAISIIHQFHEQTVPLRVQIICGQGLPGGGMLTPATLLL